MLHDQTVLNQYEKATFFVCFFCSELMNKLTSQGGKKDSALEMNIIIHSKYFPVSDWLKSHA